EPRADALDFFDRGDALANDGEFIAAEARAERACGRTLRAQTLAHRLQHAVAERVTQAVVDGFEVVEVDEQHGDARVAPARAVDRAFEVSEQLPAVRELCERIVMRKVLELSS